MPSSPGEIRPSAAGRPNVLVIMTDQHRWDMMTCAGRDDAPTPNIDRIAARGVRFTHAYCPYPVCVASRMAMLTGLYSHTTGSINNTDRLDWRYRTMAHHFADHGYLTGLIGKMHFNDGFKHGFQYYLSINDWLMYLGPKEQHYANEIANNPIGPNFFNTVDDHGAGFPDVSGLWIDGKSPWRGNVERFTFDDVASALDAEDHLDSFIARETAKFLRARRGEPFFLIASFMKPHTPLFPPREWAARYPVDRMTLPPVGDISTYPPHLQQKSQGFQKLGEKRLKAHRAGYRGNLAFVDTRIGQVLDTLEETGLLDDTILVYTSDHGELDGDHGMYQKFCLFESSVRMPLVVSYPKLIPQRKTTDALTELIGLYPTLLELTGLEPPKHTTLMEMPGAPARMDARSFADVARDPGLEGPEAAFSEYNLRAAVCSYMVRTRRYKYIFNHGTTDELYDHEADPGEYVNRIADPGLQKVRKELRDRLFVWHDPETNPFRPTGDITPRRR
ncbi:MAG: sulfatase-like hydrolase/transferase [Candidatus Sumerlaeota bacterium]|nr:sulfatase-like hydrolase/transferase [Candidatus Sumerlaeota bacterium]